MPVCKQCPVGVGSFVQVGQFIGGESAGVNQTGAIRSKKRAALDVENHNAGKV